MRSFVLIFICITCLLSAAWGTFSLELNTSSVDFGGSLHPDSSPFYEAPAVTATIINSGTVSEWALAAYGSGNITSNSQSTTIPLSQLRFKGGDWDSYTPFTVTPAIQVETGGTGTFNIVMDYKLNVYWTDIAASDYEVTIWYTLTGE
ncbi:MAG: hypothetical protein ABIH39_08050 [Candidatus Margulisiibacteriota bacterium]